MIIIGKRVARGTRRESGQLTIRVEIPSWGGARADSIFRQEEKCTPMRGLWHILRGRDPVEEPPKILQKQRRV